MWKKTQIIDEVNYERRSRVLFKVMINKLYKKWKFNELECMDAFNTGSAVLVVKWTKPCTNKNYFLALLININQMSISEVMNVVIYIDKVLGFIEF